MKKLTACFLTSMICLSGSAFASEKPAVFFNNTGSHHKLTVTFRKCSHNAAPDGTYTGNVCKPVEQINLTNKDQFNNIFLGQDEFIEVMNAIATSKEGKEVARGEYIETHPPYGEFSECFGGNNDIFEFRLFSMDKIGKPVIGCAHVSY